MKILVTGATGNVGGEVALQLARLGAPAVAAVRELEKGKAFFARHGLEIESRFFDYADPSTWQAALSGVDKIFLVIPPATTDAKQVKLFFETALEAGVQRLVFHSGRTTGDVEGEPLNVTENLVRNSGIGWTILRPCWFMQNFLNWLGFTIPADDAFYLPAADAKLAFVDVRDIAAVAAKALTESGHEGKLYEPTGPEALSHYEVAAQISEACGRTIRYVHLSDSEFVNFMVEKGWKKEDAEFTVFLFRIVRTGKEEHVSEDVPNLLGRMAVNFGQFARKHCESWKKVNSQQPMANS